MSSGKEFDERVTIRHSSFYIWNFFRLKPLRAKIDHGRNPVKKYSNNKSILSHILSHINKKLKLLNKWKFHIKYVY